MNLTIAKSVTLDATGAGQVSLGPGDQPGGRSWTVTGVYWQTNRPGQTPIPTVQVYLDQTDPGGTQALSYDGSFGGAGGEVDVPNGSHLIAVWTGGQAGDIASLTVTGTQS